MSNLSSQTWPDRTLIAPRARPASALGFADFLSKRVPLSAARPWGRAQRERPPSRSGCWHLRRSSRSWCARHIARWRANRATGGRASRKAQTARKTQASCAT